MLNITFRNNTEVKVSITDDGKVSSVELAPGETKDINVSVLDLAKPPLSLTITALDFDAGISKLDADITALTARKAALGGLK